MNPSASPFGLGPEFDAFLFASICEDRNGLTLRVVSLFGRLNLDPWQEASTLAALPAEAAVQKLASLLAALPAPLLDPPHLTRVATHLVALLPHRAPPTARSIEMLRTNLTTHPHFAIRAIVFALWIICLLGLQVTMIWRDASPHTDSAQVATPPRSAVLSVEHRRSDE